MNDSVGSSRIPTASREVAMNREDEEARLGHARTAGRGPRRAAPHGGPTSPSSPAPETLLLRIHRSKEDPETFVLDPRRSYALGRSETADLRFDDDRVSRHHATLKFDGSWRIVDAMSSNGTLVCRADDFRRTLGTDDHLEVHTMHPGEVAPLLVGNAVLIGSKHQWVELLLAPADFASKAIAEEPGAATRRSVAGKTFHEELQRASRHHASVFLRGASGAGKTYAARTIHHHSGARGRFVLINCAALPSDPTQLRSTLFGHVRGSFTGAEKDFLGHIYEAHEGTVFLDEVESLPLVAQGFLLDVIERTGDLLPLGVSKRDAPRAPSVRFISASKLPLNKSQLRMDLAHRLADGDLIRVPSLSDRKEDIAGFLEVFLEQLAKEKQPRARFSAGAARLLSQASWPGELRELRSLVEATVRACADRAGVGAAVVVHEDDVRKRLDDLKHAFGDPDAFAFGPDVSETSVNLRAPQSSETLLNAPLVRRRPPPMPPPEPLAVNPRRVTEGELRAALAATDDNIERASQRLGIARRTLMKKMDDFGIARPGRKRS